ncbi:hypothetical protein [Psychroflexus sediminis]|uniref:Chain length determinant protein n=1 Tax=Psychroflexus sediminis TaxID=470826 RepID=A0A1G7UKJ5_9FLAO|nr:hypothetical protein [Psychroflexus sediminis]SDG47250.1 hypothetical protein SAMN04488027_10296 [Psychroflexus sediminis]
MSDQSSPNQNQNDEVDLGQVFKLIGNAFKSLFQGIANIFKGLFQGLILILLHFYKRIFWYVGAVVIGLIIGFILNSTAEKSYGANMFIETNFDSGRQVYENMKQLNQLAGDKDTIELGRILKIAPDEASHLKGFYIKPNTDINVIAEMYSEYYQNLDSVSQTQETFEAYRESLSDHALPVHQIGVASTDKFIYKRIEKNFVKEIASNEYLDELSEVNAENLVRHKETLENQVNKADFLIEEYLKIKIAQSQKQESGGTNFYIGDAESDESSVNEAELLKEQLRLEEQKREVFQKMVAERDVLNVVAGFPSSGYDTREWTDKYIIKVPLALFSLTLLVFILLGLAKYLRAQEPSEG